MKNSYVFEAIAYDCGPQNADRTVLIISMIETNQTRKYQTSKESRN
jgi:hypothetical protein